ncbi:MAG TPA: radical SAM protein [Bacteroidales bacterium]|nr:radical SAM protein [Bacteroidales bacterium]
MFGNDLILPKKLVKEYNKTRPEFNRSLPICLAPYKSLRFLPDGNITVCCHNNSWSLGVFPQMSILDAWHSGELIKIRKRISKADFSYGCYECLPAYLNKNFSSVNPKLYENFETHNDFPIILDFKIATECNLECVMCSEYSSSSIQKSCNSENLKATIFGKDFVNQVSEIIPYLKEAKFSGGEPFLNNIYYEIWDLLIERNPKCKISVQTNGTILNQKIITLLESGNFHINVSVDSANPKVYQEIRRNGDYNKLLENLKYFATYSKKKNVLLGITSCNMRDNVYELPGVLKLANVLNAKLWYSDVYFPLVNSLWVLNSFELTRFVDFLESQSFESGNDLYNHNINVYKDMISRIKNFVIQAKRREEKSQYVSVEKLINDLKKVFNRNIKSNEELWSRIEFVLKNIGAHKMIDLAKEIKKYYKVDFVYTQLNLMSDEQLRSNFECLKIGVE